MLEPLRIGRVLHGDDPEPGLYGGGRVSKADPRVEAYGGVDELNAVLGWAWAAGLPSAVEEVLAGAQDVCFRLGAFLAAADEADPGVEPLTEADVGRLESAIDALEADLEPLRSFILPGGSEGAARLHVARTVCRRTERAVVALAEHATVDPLHIRWLNRLSDLLFVQARFANQVDGRDDVPWNPRKDPS